MKNTGISIIIPTYNEAGNVTRLIKRITDTMEKTDIPYEILFVDDRSTDATRSRINKYTDKYPVRCFSKKGKRGKGYSILEGFTHASHEHIVMLDADLQYPPEILPRLYAEAKKHGFAVANRKTYKSTWIRKAASRANAFVFGRLLLNLKTDVQSGLKIFPREVFEHLNIHLVSAWAIDMPLVFTAYELGYREGRVDIDFHPREEGQSNVRVARTAVEIAWGAIKTRASRRTHQIAPAGDAMIGSGLAHRRKRYTTHTTLPHHLSAFKTLLPWQRIVIAVLALAGIAGFFLQPKNVALGAVAVLSTIYFVDVLFNLYLILKSLYAPPDIEVSDEELAGIPDAELPRYSILCPLYREAHVLPQFIDSVKALDYPKNKLDVLLLLEEDDATSITAARAMRLPGYFRIVVVPDSQPKTKPKACNYGLSVARGEYIVIYDAEDRPDPKQLKKAYWAFTHADKNVACFQAKLNYYNPYDNLLTRLFTAEYSLWFDVTLPGLQAIETSIPLGGTSNHFRKSILMELHGWDSFNVTEDCDLGARLFKHGYRTAIIDSTTMEEANSALGNWVRQRSRWIKGYVQTYLVHTRQPFSFGDNHLVHAFIFHLVVGGKIAFMLINPLLWLATISYFALYAVVGPTIEALYPSIVFYMAASSLIFGNFLCMYYYMIGCAKRDHWSLMKYVFLVPFYWLMVSFAAAMAFVQLVVKPHYWEKTVHGLNLPHAPAVKEVAAKTDVAAAATPGKLSRFLHSGMTRGGLLVAATVTGSLLNFLYNAFLGRSVPIETFGIINLFGTFFYLVSIPIGALGKTVTYRSAYLLGKYGKPVYAYWATLQRPLLVTALGSTLAWFLAMPAIAQFFHLPSLLPLLLFSPIWLVGIGAAANTGFLSGTHQFSLLAALTVIDAAVKLLAAVAIISMGSAEFIYIVIPLAIGIEYLLGALVISKRSQTSIPSDPQTAVYFPKRFFATSILSILSTATFLTVDVILVNHYMSPLDAGHYGLLSLVGKMIIVAGSMFGQFLTPIVSREIGAGRDGSRQFYMLLAVTTAVCLVGFTVVGLYGHITVPLLFGKDVASVVGQLPLYTLAMVFFTIASSVISYHQIRKEYAFPVVGFLLALVQITGLILFHTTLSQVVAVMFGSALLQLVVMVLLHVFREQIRVVVINAADFLGLFSRLPTPTLADKRLRILIFNWRDTKHVWAGGAETYIHEMARQWVHMGHAVTLFCGNDGKTPRNQAIDGVQVVRRGGFYMVYVWAFLYYMLKFRGRYDVVIDSENGVPFFTPLYARVPVFLLIHHVHQGVFRERLSFPLANVASFLESVCMPRVYKHCRLITVSESSKKDILVHKLASQEAILVVNPGVAGSEFARLTKTQHPTLLYLGRLKAYKNVDVAIKAFGVLHKKFPKAKLIIAGEGEEQDRLTELARQLKLSRAVSFLGRVNEKKKVELFATSWTAIQPSSHEGWGISVIEANASGTPVIASAINGLKDSVIDNQTGLLVPPKNLHALAAAMETLVTNDALRKKLSAEAYEWSKSFSWERNAEHFIDHVSQILEQDAREAAIAQKGLSFSEA